MACKEIQEIEKNIKEEQQRMEANRNDEIRRINQDNEKLKETDMVFNSQVKTLEFKIMEQDEEIKRLIKEEERLRELFHKEIEDKDAQINEQRKLFEDMSIRFQHILQRTANKLQERVNMAGI